MLVASHPGPKKSSQQRMTATFYPLDDGNVYDCGSKPFALILYNPTSRNGALEEAIDLQSGLDHCNAKYSHRHGTLNLN